MPEVKEFSDHFGSVSSSYAKFRPTYPADLFDWLVAIVPGHAAAWDCACGSGQASVDLAARFERVMATDASAGQIESAVPHARVEYRVASAEKPGLPDASVDLVTVAQALHWFDVNAFYAEARRVARPGALLAVWNYPRPRFVDAELDRHFLEFYGGVVGPYWPAERRHIESNYTTLPFPFEELAHPEFGLTLRWNLEQVLGYVSSWSATARYRKARGDDPVPLLRASLQGAWPGDGAVVEIRLPIGLRAARLE